VQAGTAYRLQEFPLQPGDRLVFVTDGMQERNAATLDVAAALADSAGQHPREVVHALGAAVMRATGGILRDDATVVCLDWYGGPMRRRDSSGGASAERASSRSARPTVGTSTSAVRPPVPGRFRPAGGAALPSSLVPRCTSTGPAGPSSPSRWPPRR
jgi:hypothetical protein